MKITAIETLQWEHLPRIIVVRVHTDVGIIGLGESVDKVHGTKGAIHGTLAPLLLGQDPLDIEGLWRFAMDNIMYHGYAGAETRALSAIEIALWDIMGKFYQAPLYHLLGGKTRERIPTYNTCIGTPDVPDYIQWQTDAGGLAKSLLSDGIRALKIWSFDKFSESSFGQYISHQSVQEGLKPIQQIRDAVGHEMEIGVECHFRWNRASMERIVEALEPYNILFIEDAIAAVHPKEIKALSQKTRIPFVGSELLMTRWQLRDWIQEGITQIVMTDPVWNGGIAETRKIANLAEAYGIPLVLHNVASPICHAVCMHLGAHIPNLFFAESVRAFYKTYFSEMCGWTPTIENGNMTIPDGVGLGVELTPHMLSHPKLTRLVSDGEGLAKGRRAMGDHWAVEEIR
ncbi:MAG: mandelate racemase/muconate lactonizing enzyme family protein [Phototrophicaceae bacterium]